MSEAAPRKPRFALFIATAAGLGYLPKAPGTWGSLLGLFLGWALRNHDLGMLHPFAHPDFIKFGGIALDRALALHIAVMGCLAVLGVWVSGRAASYLGQKDPQNVVIDEVSGQMIALLGAGWVSTFSSDDLASASAVFALISPGWKYLLLGFILFRACDIWKPFPVRQAESLPGGWGIMADDWVAGIYAALGLWIARMLGL
jgi:phosphatidylglycerophosphatase A